MAYMVKKYSLNKIIKYQNQVNNYVKIWLFITQLTSLSKPTLYMLSNVFTMFSMVFAIINEI